jgi:hypothetical protein
MFNDNTSNDVDRGDDLQINDPNRPYEPKPFITGTESQIAQDNWSRYEYGRLRGHTGYIKQAQKCERFYLGYQEDICEGQWTEEHRKWIESKSGRLAIELNFCQPIVETVTGHQIQSKTDISLKPRWGAATQQVADTLSQLLMQLYYDNKVHYLETEQFRDGMIEQRGYTDVRMDFTENIYGDIVETLLDPRDCIPDPDANQYEPKTWSDFIVTRMLSLNQIEQFYGPEARQKVENYNYDDHPFSQDDQENNFPSRNTFGTKVNGTFDAYVRDKDRNIKNVRVIDRQFKVYTMIDYFLNPITGDLRPVPENKSPEEIQQILQAENYVIHRKMGYKIRWRVTTADLVLFDSWSPYSSFTIIPYFPYFRRGRTKGIVDNAISPQEMINKATSSELHILNTTANSGWIIEEHSLVDITPEDLEDTGGKTGIVLQFKKGATAPRRIEPAGLPTGMDRLSDKAREHLNLIVGVSEAQQGQNSPEISGVAVQSKQFANQLQMQGPLQNLARTREMRAGKYIDLIQQFYTVQRVFMINKENQFGETTQEQLTINAMNVSGQIVNNLTMGEYDIVIDSIPASVTFNNSQFQQAMSMKKEGIQIPDTRVVLLSNLSKKAEIAKEMAGQADPEAAALQKRAAAAKVAADEARARMMDNKATQEAVTSVYSGVQAAQIIAQLPQVSMLADDILLSAGFKDSNKPPIVPQTQGIDVPPPESNTRPMFPPKPDSPALGAMGGIEGGQ